MLKKNDFSFYETREDEKNGGGRILLGRGRIGRGIGMGDES